MMRTGPRFPLRDDPAQLLHGAEDARLDGANFAAEELSDLAVLHIVVTAQDQDLALVLRKLQERATQELVLVPTLEIVRGSDRLGHLFLELDLGRSPEVIGARVARDLIDPRLERVARPVG